MQAEDYVTSLLSSTSSAVPSAAWKQSNPCTAKEASFWVSVRAPIRPEVTQMLAPPPKVMLVAVIKVQFLRGHRRELKSRPSKGSTTETQKEARCLKEAVLQLALLPQRTSQVTVSDRQFAVLRYLKILNVSKCTFSAWVIAQLYTLQAPKRNITWVQCRWESRWCSCVLCMCLHVVGAKITTKINGMEECICLTWSQLHFSFIWIFLWSISSDFPRNTGVTRRCLISIVAWDSSISRKPAWVNITKVHCHSICSQVGISNLNHANLNIF